MQKDTDFDVITQKIREAREDLFQYNIDAGIKKTVDLIQQLMPVAKEKRKEAELNQITSALMEAMRQKDYLLFADISCYEIPALFVNPESPLGGDTK